jgi:hypothetical protein
MMYETQYYYSDGIAQLPIARIFYDGETIGYEILCEGNSLTFDDFVLKDVRAHIRQIIHLPIARSELRARTMPDCFSRIQPNSIEHFLAVPHDTTYFRFTPVILHNSQATGA